MWDMMTWGHGKERVLKTKGREEIRNKGYGTVMQTKGNDSGLKERPIIH